MKKMQFFNHPLPPPSLEGKAQFSILRLFFIFFLMVTALSADEIYTVQRGDTLDKISKKFNISINELKSINNLSNNNIRAGQKLTVNKHTNLREIYYTVRAGDTLSNIATRNNTTVSQIVNWNNLKSSNITINQRLIVGYSSDGRPQNTDQNEDYHIVQRGETLTSISRKYDIPLVELMDLNNLPDFSIKVGQKLLLKSDSTDVVTVESGTEEPKTHIVKRGENLYRIGLKYGVTVDELKEWNGLKDINIREGQVLVLMYIPFSTPDRQPEQAPIISKKAIMPIENGKVFSEFGMRNRRMHKGIDLGAPPGTPIYAVLPGTVIFAGRQRGYGNVVIIQHDESIITVYAHNESNRVSVNDRVTQGHIIATVGNTGNTRAYHVHFEYRFQGTARNPRELLPL